MSGVLSPADCLPFREWRWCFGGRPVASASKGEGLRFARGEVFVPFILEGSEEDSTVIDCGTWSEVDDEAEDVAVKARARRVRGDTADDWRGDGRRPDDQM